MPPQGQYYNPKQEYVGKSLRQVNSQLLTDTGHGIGNLDTISSFLGLSPDQPLNSDLTVPLSSISKNYRGGSSELEGFYKLFNPGMSPEEKAVQPAIQSYNQEIPEIQSQFSTAKQGLEAQRQPLEDRYKALIDSIKGNQQVATNRQSQTTTNELGRRGITGGGLYDQTLSNALDPLNLQFGGLLGQTNASHEQDVNSLNQLLANNPVQETAAERAIKNAIAQVQVGASQQTVQDALAQAKMEQEGDQFKQQQQLAQSQFDWQKNFASTQANVSKGLTDIWGKYFG